MDIISIANEFFKQVSIDYIYLGNFESYYFCIQYYVCIILLQ